MKYRRLGSTGIQVSEIGFGAWGIGGSANGDVAYGPTDPLESKLALRRAFDLGVTFYDTADFYGFGQSERLIGEAFHDVRRQVVIASKVGLLDAKGSQDFSSNHVRRSIEASLRRLQTDYIDLYQLHSPAMEVLDRDDRILPLLDSLQKEGKIRTFGISVRSPDDGLIAVKKYGFRCLQVNFNMLDQRAAENGLFTLCERQDVGIIVRTPLCFGFLTGKYADYAKFGSLDHRHRWAPEQIQRWAGAYQLFAAALIGCGNQTQAQIALRFCLSYSGVSTVIPGMLTRDQVEENVAASELGPLLDEDQIKFEEIYRKHNFFVARPVRTPTGTARDMPQGKGEH